MTTDLRTVTCPACAAEYALPEATARQLVGRWATCSGCRRPFLPFPAPGASPSLGQGGLGTDPVDLSPYRRDETPFDFFAAAAAPPPSPSPLRTTARVAPPGAPPAVPMLRVTTEGPDVDTRAVFDLGPRSFFIGATGGHLNLPSAALPPRAIRIRTTRDGFVAEGLGTYRLPTAGASTASLEVGPDAPVTLAIGPYRVVLEVSRTPGSPIADLDAPAPAAGAKADLRSLVPPPPPPAAGAPPPVTSETIRDLMAPGFAAQSFRDPLQGLLVGFVGQEGAFRGKSYRVTKGSVIIGRTTGDMLVPDGRVSSKHAQFDVMGLDQYSLKDLASTNGTTVNGRPISTTQLRMGDLVGFGGVTFQFVVKPAK